MQDESGSERRDRGVWRTVEEKLASLGIDLDELCTTAGGSRVKVVCVAPDLGSRVRDLGRSPREHVVMVRVDEDTLRKLDAWVETGAVRSRSEAAALFIREGLQVRGDELKELEDAIKKVEQAKQKLREKAKVVFGGHAESDEKEP